MNFAMPRMRGVTASLLLMAATVSARAEQASGQTLQDCDHCPTMVVVAAGQFNMGEQTPAGSSPLLFGSGPGGAVTNAASPPHEVRLAKPFALGQHEVTYAEFATFVSESGYDLGLTGCTLVDAGGDPGVYARDTTVSWQIIKNRSWKYPLWPNVNDSNPVTCISWNDAQAYMAWLSKRSGHTYRLPTEAEWEYAARAGSVTRWFWGDDATQACRYGNVTDQRFLKQRRRSPRPGRQFDCDDGFAFNAPVMSFQPNAWGLFDMIGNVAEWTADCWHSNYQGAPSDSRAWSEDVCLQRVVRGDSGILNIDWTQIAYRAPQSASDYRSNVLGFRVARDL